MTVSLEKYKCFDLNSLYPESALSEISGFILLNFQTLSNRKWEIMCDICTCIKYMCEIQKSIFICSLPPNLTPMGGYVPTSTLQENEKNIWQLHNSCGLCWHYVLGYQLTALVRLSDQYGLVGHYLFFNCAISEVLYYVMEILRFSNTREI